MPELNRELFQKIHQQITDHPETHHQSYWETACGTTRCVAGWAVHLTTNAPVYEPGGSVESLSFQTRSLAEDVLPDHAVRTVPSIARRLLGLDAEEAGRIFYASGDDAREAVRLAAEGTEEQFAEFVAHLFDPEPGID